MRLEIQFRLRVLYLLMKNEIVYFPIVGDVLLIRFDIVCYSLFTEQSV